MKIIQVIIVFLMSLNVISQELKVIVPSSVSEKIINSKFSPNGELLGVVTKDNIQIWNSTNGGLLYKYNPHSNSIYTLDFSLDSKIIATGSMDNHIAIFDIENDTLILFSSIDSTEISKLKFNPNNPDELFVLTDKNFYLYNYKKNLRVKQLNRYEFNSFKFSPDYTKIAFSSSRGITIFDINSFKEIGAIKQHSLGNHSYLGMIQDFCFSPDSKLIYSLGKQDKSAAVFSVIENKILDTIRLDQEYYQNILKVDDTLYIVDGTGNYIIWNTITRKLENTEGNNNIILPFENKTGFIIAKLNQYYNKLESFRINKKGTYYPISNSKRLKIGSEFCHAVINPIKNHILSYFTSSYENTDAYIYDFEHNKIEIDLTDKNIPKFGYSSIKKNKVLVVDENSKLAKIIDLKNGNVINYFAPSDYFLSYDTKFHSSIALSNDGNKIAIGTEEEFILIDLITSDVLQKINFHNEGFKPHGLQFSFDDRFVVAQSGYKIVAVDWEKDTIINYHSGPKQGNKVFASHQLFKNKNILLATTYTDTYSADANRLVAWDLEKGEVLFLQDSYFNNKLICISSNEEMLAVSDDSYIKVFKIQGNRIFQINKFELDQTWSFFLNIQFIDEDQSIIATTSNNYIRLFPLNSTKGKIFTGHKHVVDEIYLIPGKSQFFITTSWDNSMKLWSNSKLITSFNSGINKIINVSLSLEDKKLYSISESGEIARWNLFTGKKEMSHILVGNEKVTILSSLHYMTTPNVAKKIRFANGINSHSFDQFDLKYNRPDLVLKEMENPDSNLIHSYYMAYRKRLKYLKFSEEMLESSTNVPTVTITNISEIPKYTKKSEIKLSLELEDKDVSLDRLLIWNNDVAQYGRKGISIRKGNHKNHSIKVNLSLASGVNNIQVSVLNSSGIESIRKSIIIHNTEPVKNKNLYLIAIGASKFQNESYNLKYASKDARDIINQFKESDLYNKVNTILLEDEKVVLSEINQLKQFLSKATINDEVLIFFAGHGILDADLNYYLASNDIDFDHPNEKGIPYSKIESILDSIAPLKKILLIDACHSGEIDKDEVELAQADVSEKGAIQFRAVGNSAKPKLGVQNTSELTKSLFTDLRKGTGATIISSAGGMEFAIESGEWKNGLFTYCLLNGIRSNKADLNHDGEIWLSELKQYVQKQVNILSNGKQQPTSRIENNVLDWRIW